MPAAIESVPLGGGFGARKTTTRPRPSKRPSRLQRPAAWAIEFEPSDRAVNDGEVEVDAGFDELRGDDTDGAARLVQGRPDRGEHLGSVRRAHQRREVKRAFGHQGVKVASGVASIDDAQSARFIREKVGQLVPRDRAFQPVQPFHPDAAKTLAQRLRIGRQLARLGLQALEPLSFAECRLGCGREKHRRAVAGHQLVKREQDRAEMARREKLGLVEHDDRAGEVVELAATRRLRGEERFEELHRRRDDNRRFPVLGGEAGRVGIFVWGEVTMVLDDNLAVLIEDPVKNVGRLFDNARVGDGVDHTSEIVGAGMPESEGQRGERLATTSGHGEREEARRQARLLAARGEDLGTGTIDLARCSGDRLGVEAAVEGLAQGGQRWP